MVESSVPRAFTFTQLDQNVTTFLVIDSLLTALRALRTIAMDHPDTLAAFDDLSARAAAARKHPFAVALSEDVQVSTGVAAIVFSAVLYRWHSGAAEVARDTILAFQLLQPAGYPVGIDRDSRVLYRVLAAIDGLAPLHLEKRWIVSDAERARRAFVELAAMLDDGTHAADALACAEAATNLAVEHGDAKAQALALSITLARKAGNRDSAAFAAALRANTLANLAEADSARRIDAYNAFDAAARELPMDPKLRKEAGRLLNEWLKKSPYLRPLGPVFWLSLRPEERQTFPVDVAPFASAAQTVWDGDVESWLRETKLGVQWAMQIEDARLALEAPLTRERAGAAWTTWSMNHPALARAIPHGTSLEREENFLETLLVLNHEITHVYSMAGHLGVADQALRWTWFEREIDLWSFTVPPGARLDANEIVGAATLAPLSGPRVEALAQAEQALELALKMRLLEAVWSPWLEGLAVLGELAGDPRMDPLFSSPVTNVVSQLIDLSLKPTDSSLEAMQDAARRAREEAEEVYGRAIAAHARYRLRTYVVEQPEVYLGGYLAVRSVVSAWRARLDRAVSGAEAFRVLLHMSRFGTAEAIPDLGLPAAEFAEAVLRLHIAWVHWTADAAADDLERILGGADGRTDRPRFIRWIRGRLVDEGSVSPLKGQDASLQIAETLASQAIASLCGERASPDRVVGADDGCRSILVAAADVLLERARKRPPLFSRRTALVPLARQMILRIGETASPFWLIKGSHSIACVVRTTERSRGHDYPGYDVSVFSVAEEQFQRLEETLAGGAEPRMRITRIADLTEREGDEGVRGYGTNFIVFQCGGWTHIQPRGILFGVTKVDPTLEQVVESRLNADPLIHAWEAMTQDGKAGARRTAEWLDSVGDWSSVNPSVDFTPWVDHLRELAAKILDDDDAKRVGEMASQGLLEFVLGDAEAVTRLRHQGLAVLDDDEPGGVGALTQLLDESARAPVTEIRPGLDALVSARFGPLLTHGASGWDVTPPLGAGKD